MQRPNTFIIGAPKCGTTSLGSWLREHPQVFMSPIKEPNFFNTDVRVPFRPSPRRYATLFRGARPEHRVVGEATTRYLASEAAVPGILAYRPDARFVVMVRNPVDMAPSLHQQAVYSGREDVESFPAAWKLQEARARGERLPPRSLNLDGLQYGRHCRLGEHLRRVRSLVDPARLHVIVLDDLKQDPRGTYRRLLAFLEIDDDERSEFPVRNAAKTVRSTLARRLITLAWHIKLRLGISRSLGVAALNRRPQPRQPLTAELRRELYAYFQADIRLLERLLDRELPEWHLATSPASAPPDA